MRGFTTQLARHFTAAANHRTDGELLTGFLSAGVEADFADLVRRHGPLVWGACRRTLPDPTDAEDVFQAVFLVLVPRGNRLTDRATIGPWLHRVAVWTARNVRRRNARRLAKQVSLAEPLPAPTTDRDLALDLDAALLALPEKFRSPIVLCHLLGYSRADAAAQLGCAEGTLSAWLSRGLARLRVKLRGLDPATVLGLAAVTAPVGLSGSVVRAAVASRVTTLTASVLSTTVSQLVEGAIRMFWIKKATVATVSLCSMFALGVGIGLSGRQLAPVASGQEKPGIAQAIVKPTPEAGPDLDDRIMALEEEIQVAERAFKGAVEGARLAGKKVAFSQSKGVDEKSIRDDVETLLRFEQNAARYEKNLTALRDKLKVLQELKKPKKVTPEVIADDKPSGFNKSGQAKSPPATVDDVDRQLADLKLKLAALQVVAQKLRAEGEQNHAELRAIEVGIAQLQARKAELTKGEGMQVPTGAYLQLSIGTKDAAWPFLVKEFGVDGKPIGTMACENAAVLGRFLARTVKDAVGPKEIRITTRTDVSSDVLTAAIDACKAAGIKQVLLSKGGDNPPAIDPKVEAAKRLYNAELLKLYRLQDQKPYQLEEKKKQDFDEMTKRELEKADQILRDEERKLRDLLEIKRLKLEEQRQLEELRKREERLKQKPPEPASPIK